MKKLFQTLTLLLPVTMTQAEDKSLTPAEIQSRLQITGEIYIFDTEGERVLYKSSTKREWIPGSNPMIIDSNWSSSSDQFKPIALKHRWEILPDSRIKVTIEQFEKINNKKENEPVFETSLKKEEYFLKDFSPITWRSLVDKEKRVVVRFTPTLFELPTNFSGDLPISASGILAFDNFGQIWANHFTIEGKYIGIQTHKGSVFISYYPFKGAKVLGTVSGDLLTLGDMGDHKTSLMLQSTTPFLPNGMNAKVYGIVQLDRKTERLNSQHFNSSNKEEEFLKSAKLAN